MKGSARLSRAERAQPQAVAVQVLSVAQSVTDKGLTVAKVQQVLLLADQWRYLVLRCPGCDLITSQVMVDDAWIWSGAPLVYCCGCGQARIWV